MIDNQMIRDAVDRLLDEGLHPVTIRAVLLPFVGQSELSQTLLRTIVDEQTRAWLQSAEVQLQNYAGDESWQRLGALLETYRKVTA